MGESRIATESLITAGMQHIDDAPRDVGEPLEKARDLTVACRLTSSARGFSTRSPKLSLPAAAGISRWSEQLRQSISLRQTITYASPSGASMSSCPWPQFETIGLCWSGLPTWYRALEGRFEFPDSPYARVIRPAQDLELADAGLWPAYVPSVDSCLAGFATEPGGPSWCAALDRVTRSWIDTGAVEGAMDAVDGMERHTQSTQVSELGRGTSACFVGGSL